MAGYGRSGKRRGPCCHGDRMTPNPIIGFAAVIGVIICVLIIAFASDE
jgi:hypothetical protein